MLPQLWIISIEWSYLLKDKVIMILKIEEHVVKCFN